MNNRKEIEKASGVVFPILLNAVSQETPDTITYDLVRQWGEITLKILNQVYPEDIFTGVSGDKGVKAVNTIREILKLNLKNKGV